MGGTKLVECERLVPAFLLLSGQVKRLAGVLPGLIAAARQPTDLAEPCDPVGMIEQRACAGSVADRLLQQRAPRREAPLQRIGRAQTGPIPRNQDRLPEARQRVRPCSSTRT